MQKKSSTMSLDDFKDMREEWRKSIAEAEIKRIQYLKGQNHAIMLKKGYSPGCITLIVMMMPLVRFTTGKNSKLCILRIIKL